MKMTTYRSKRFIGGPYANRQYAFDGTTFSFRLKHWCGRYVRGIWEDA
jgi:hypothetical protein